MFKHKLQVDFFLYNLQINNYDYVMMMIYF